MYEEKVWASIFVDICDKVEKEYKKVKIIIEKRVSKNGYCQSLLLNSNFSKKIFLKIKTTIPDKLK